MIFHYPGGGQLLNLFLDTGTFCSTKIIELTLLSFDQYNFRPCQFLLNNTSNFRKKLAHGVVD